MHFSDRKSLVGTFVCDSLEPERILLANRLQQLQLVCTHVSGNTVVFAFLSSSFSGTSCGPCLTRILRLLRLPAPLNPHHQHRQHHHCHDYHDYHHHQHCHDYHRSSSAKYLTKIFRRCCLAFFSSPLWRSTTHKLLSHFSIFSSVSLFCMFMSTFLFF